MNALKVNYIQMEKYSLFSCCQRFRELLLEMPPKRVFREPNNAKEEKDYLDSCIPKVTRYVTKWAVTKCLANGKVKEEIKTPTLRKEDLKSKWTVFKV